MSFKLKFCWGLFVLFHIAFSIVAIINIGGNPDFSIWATQAIPFITLGIVLEWIYLFHKIWQSDLKSRIKVLCSLGTTSHFSIALVFTVSGRLTGSFILSLVAIGIFIIGITIFYILIDESKPNNPIVLAEPNINAVAAADLVMAIEPNIVAEEIVSMSRGEGEEERDVDSRHITSHSSSVSSVSSIDSALYSSYAVVSPVMSQIESHSAQMPASASSSAASLSESIPVGNSFINSLNSIDITP